MASTINATTSSGIVATADNTGSLALQTSGTTAVTIDTSQNVGIGTASPSTKLDVVGVINASGNVSTSSGNFVLGANDTYLGFASNNIKFNNTSDRITLTTGATERMRIDSSGNLLVGVSLTGTGNSASFQLQGPTSTSVTRNVGPILTKGYSTSAGLPSIVINWGSSGYSGLGPDSGANDNTFRIGIVSNDANGWYWNGYANVKGGTYTNASDYRIKKNVETVTEDVLPLIAQARLVSYNVIRIDEDGNDVDTPKEIGFIAHELQELFPTFVTGQKDDVDLSGEIHAQAVDYAKLTAICFKAIQEQQTIINDLKARIETLEAK